jgi:hypothetical protein
MLQLGRFGQGGSGRFLCQDTGPEAQCPTHELVWGEVALVMAHIPGLQSLGGHAARGEALAHPLALGRRHAQAEAAA